MKHGVKLRSGSGLFQFHFAFMPLYILGFMGMTRRLNTYDNPEWDPYIAIGILRFCVSRDWYCMFRYANCCWLPTTQRQP